MAVAFQGLDFAFADGPPLFSALDLTVVEGSITALVGRSGCGKSTLLRLAAGLLGPTGGTVRSAGPQAFVFQDPTLLPWRSLLENVALPLQLEGRDPVERRARAQAALAGVGLADVGGRLPHQVSGGQRMRASLARALVNEPRLLLLDEAFSALDAITRRQVQGVFQAVHARLGFTALMVTHDVEEAVWLSDRVVVLGGQPAQIRASAPVDLPRLRARSMRHRPEVVAVAERLEAAL